MNSTDLGEELNALTLRAYEAGLSVEAIIDVLEDELAELDRLTED